MQEFRPGIRKFVCDQVNTSKSLGPVSRPYQRLLALHVPQSDFVGAAGTSCVQLRRPVIKRAQPLAAAADANADVIKAVEADERPGFLDIPVITWKKILPLGFMFFAILFNYTILRDTKVSWSIVPCVSW